VNTASREHKSALTPQLVIRKIVDDLETPVSAFLKLAQNEANSFLFESVEGGSVSARYSILTLRPDLVWRCYGEAAQTARDAAITKGAFEDAPEPSLDSLRALIKAHQFTMPDDVPPMACGLFGVFGYDMIRLYEPLGAPNPDSLVLPDAVVVRPTIICIFDNVAHEITLSSPLWPEHLENLGLEAATNLANERIDAIEARMKRPLPARETAIEQPSHPLLSQTKPADFARMVDRAKSYIEAGDIFQVVLSHRFEAPYGHDPFAFYRSLRRLNPSPYLFYLNFGEFQLAGSSPEILVRVRDGKLTIRPIAGTRPRGKTPAEDRALEVELLADPKELSEHLMLLDLGRNDVGRVAKPATVRVTEKFAIERYSHVLHIVSNVEGDAPDDLDPVEALLAALPAGTLSGAPKVRAMEIIDALESVKRGVGYGGGVGYISSNGSVDICIVLRTALFKDKHIYVQAGAGIVADSVAQTEFEETVHKAGALIKAARESWRFEIPKNWDGANF
jgi:anthranilate synthase component 1